MTKSRLFAASLLACSALGFAAPGPCPTRRPHRRVRRQLCRRRQFLPAGRTPARRRPIPPAASRAAPITSTRLALCSECRSTISPSAARSPTTPTPMARRCPASSPNGMHSWPAAAAPSRPSAASFDENDLLTVSIGGNDARFYQQTAAPWPGAPAAADRVGRLCNGRAQRLGRRRRAEHQLPRRQYRDPSGNRRAIRRPRRFATPIRRPSTPRMQSTLSGYAANGVDRPLSRPDTCCRPGHCRSGGLWPDRRSPARRLPSTSCIADPTQKFLFYVRPAAPDLGRLRHRRPIYRGPARSAADAAGDQRHEPRRRSPVRPDADRADGHAARRATATCPKASNSSSSATASPQAGCRGAQRRPIARAASARPPASNMASDRASPASPSITPGPRSISAMTPPDNESHSVQLGGYGGLRHRRRLRPGLCRLWLEQA